MESHLKNKLQEILDRANQATLIRPVPGYDGYYADWEGNIWSVLARGVAWFKLKPSRQKNGYTTVSPLKSGKRQSRLTHRLVCLAWYGEPKYKQETRHLNGIRDDNRVSNLCWGTNLENAADRKLHGNDTGAENGRRSSYKLLGRGHGAKYDKETKRWYAQISFRNKRYFLGVFDTKSEATKAYRKRAKEFLKLCEEELGAK